MKHVIIAPVGDDIENLFISIREFAIDKIFLVASKQKRKIAENWAEKLRIFNIDNEIYEIESEDFENFLRAVSRIISVSDRGGMDNSMHNKDRFIINVSTGDKISACIALSAAFILGIKAFGVRNKQAMLFPIMKFSYTKVISDRKMRILKEIEREELTSEEIAKRTKMSMPLVSYHINGNEKAPGLISLGLVESYSAGGRNKLRLTLLGKLIIRGYLIP